LFITACIEKHCTRPLIVDCAIVQCANVHSTFTSQTSALRVA